MRKVKDAKDLSSNELIYFKGHAQATYMSDGRTVEDAIAQAGQGGGGSATPSGDPMHYAYVEAGAEYNDTGADIEKVAPWAEVADSDAEKKVIHKAGCWYLNGLGDLTNSDIQKSYAYWKKAVICEAYNETPIKTNFPFQTIGNGYNMHTAGHSYGTQFLFRACTHLLSASVLTIHLTEGVWHSCFDYSKNVVAICGKLRCSRISQFYVCYALKYVQIEKLKSDVIFAHSANLSKGSILYMIQDEAATSAITITLHADAYARAMADTAITSALEAHPNITLASA